MKRRQFLCLCFLFILCLSACKAAGGQTIAWIDVPLNDANYSGFEPVKIEGHASSASGVEWVELLVNNAPAGRLEVAHTSGNLASFQTTWTPPSPGDYLVEVVAYGIGGEVSTPDSALIHVLGETIPELTLTDSTPVITTEITPLPGLTLAVPTPTNTTPPEVLVKFWADPATITAGACTTLHWDTENVKQVVFGGLSQPLVGTYNECLCAPTNYRLSVTMPDDRVEEFWVNVTVTGSCVTPTPEDKTSPPAPTLVVPGNGLTVACNATQTLAWLPVTDSSGIAEYQVEVQRSTNKIVWTNAAGSPFTGLTDKTISISTTCGNYYRWRVRAIDNAGNIGDWSGWFNFSMPIS